MAAALEDHSAGPLIGAVLTHVGITLALWEYAHALHGHTPVERSWCLLGVALNPLILWTVVNDGAVPVLLLALAMVLACFASGT